jgi:hypothetical protein
LTGRTASFRSRDIPSTRKEVKGKGEFGKGFVRYSLRELEKARASGAKWSVKPFQTTMLCKPIGIHPF